MAQNTVSHIEGDRFEFGSVDQQVIDRVINPQMKKVHW